MKKTLLLSLTLLSLAQTSNNLRAEYDPVYLNSTLLSLVDGKFINAGEIFRYAKNIILLRIGGKSLATAEALVKAYDFETPFSLKEGNKNPAKIGLVPYKNVYYTVEDLEKIEAEGGDHDELQKSLAIARQHFDKLSADYVSQIQIAKEYMVKLIDQWSMLRNEPDTLLLNWGKLDCTERESMHASLTSFKILNTFFGHLLLFLADLMHNCPKSLKKYQESLKARGSTAATN